MNAARIRLCFAQFLRSGREKPYRDNELKAILAHNRDEEKEHAAMVLEWIRRKDPSFDKELKDYLFTEKPIAHESRLLYEPRFAPDG